MTENIFHKLTIATVNIFTIGSQLRLSGNIHGIQLHINAAIAAQDEKNRLPFCTVVASIRECSTFYKEFETLNQKYL